MSNDSTPIKDALQKLETEPITDTAALGVVGSRDGGFGLAGQVSTTLGKGWSATAAGEWRHRTGWQVIAGATWKKSKGT